jgi:hypothetical protein
MLSSINEKKMKFNKYINCSFIVSTCYSAFLNKWRFFSTGGKNYRPSLFASRKLEAMVRWLQIRRKILD